MDLLFIICIYIVIDSTFPGISMNQARQSPMFVPLILFYDEIALLCIVLSCELRFKRGIGLRNAPTTPEFLSIFISIVKSRSSHFLYEVSEYKRSFLNSLCFFYRILYFVIHKGSKVLKSYQMGTVALAATNEITTTLEVRYPVLHRNLYCFVLWGCSVQNY